MRRRNAVLLAGCLGLTTATCQDFLDVNTNPNAPETVTANLYLPPLLHWMITAPQFDGRFVGHYAQEWMSTSTAFSPAQTWRLMGFDPGSDNGGEHWRTVYWIMGQNLVDMMTKAEAEQRWDLLGVGYILEAWGWHALAGLHGEIIVKEAINPTTFNFNYDTQEFAYEEARRLLNEAITLLQRTDGAVDATYLATGDKIYNGDRTKWLKFAYGLLALNLNHYSNKAAYDPAAVIAAVDASFTSNADDALLAFPNLDPGSADRNFLGRTRNNFTLYRQTRFIVNLMNGTEFAGAVDPRMSRMLSPAPDGEYRGLDINVAGFGALAPAQQPNNPYGYPGTGGLGQPGRYLFDDRVNMPAMTYSQLQFVKAEAAYRRGDMVAAQNAYINGIASHIDFVNARISEAGQTSPQISAAEKAAFLANPAIVPAALTLTHIMSQKYIAQWAWGHNELWMDMRRYHYTDIDPASGRQVFTGFAPPTTLYALNAGKVVQRIRPRYNSEYVWNRAGLEPIGGLADDYHTKPLWITQP
jgi:hypothetical protein